MLVRTKEHPTESVRFIGPAPAIKHLRKLAREAGVMETADSIPATEINLALENNPGGVYLRGVRHRDNLTQDQLAALVGIPRRHISEMENGHRNIGKASAKKLAGAFDCDYRAFL